MTAREYLKIEQAADEILFGPKPEAPKAKAAAKAAVKAKAKNRK